MPINPIRYISNKIQHIFFPHMLPKQKTSTADIINFLARAKRPYNLNRRIIHLNPLFNKETEKTIKISKKKFI